jgi:hypothetical protein
MLTVKNMTTVWNFKNACDKFEVIVNYGARGSVIG